MLHQCRTDTFRMCVHWPQSSVESETAVIWRVGDKRQQAGWRWAWWLPMLLKSGQEGQTLTRFQPVKLMMTWQTSVNTQSSRDDQWSHFWSTNCLRFFFWDCIFIQRHKDMTFIRRKCHSERSNSPAAQRKQDTSNFPDKSKRRHLFHTWF